MEQSQANNLVAAWVDPTKPLEEVRRAVASVLSEVRLGRHQNPFVWIEMNEEWDWSTDGTVTVPVTFWVNTIAMLCHKDQDESYLQFLNLAVTFKKALQAHLAGWIWVNNPGPPAAFSRGIREDIGNGSLDPLYNPTLPLPIL